MTLKSDFLNVLEARGFLQDCTDPEGLDQRLNQGVVSAYIGFDCTADSLHVGSLIQIMLLRWLQKTGHHPVVLMGGGTTRIGDPSGKDEARALLTDAQIAENMAGIRRVFANYLTFGEGPAGAIMPNNAEWLNGLVYIDFLRDYGRHFTINRMLTFDSVRLRLEREQPLTFLEFNYMLLQAYDFLELFRREGVALQMGGSDQWGNIVNGVELCRRAEGAQVWGLVSPLLTRADGSKMGKTASGAVWLNEEKLPNWDFWQFWRNTPDADVERFLKLYTELPVDECERLGRLGGAEINEAKKVLANEVTALARGRAAAEAAAATAREVFEEGGTGRDLPTLVLAETELGPGIPVAQLLVRAGLAASGREAKRLIAEGGARLNDAPVIEGQLLGPDAFGAGEVKLSAGRKRHAVIRLG
ncbi:MAG TPA: tyrosine--tRNA ligase [Paracoccaceae bacterium]|nr:tyrosine--tRNA ligase [Paracoccaceae bacterium]